MYSFSLTIAVFGFHIYKHVWEPTIAGVNFIQRFLVTDHFACFSTLVTLASQLAIDDDAAGE